jgi:site-specific recombinase
VSTEPLNASPSAATGQLQQPGPESFEQKRVAPEDLVRSVSDFCEARTIRKRTSALVGLLNWTRRASKSVADLSGLPGLIEYLESNPDVRSRVQSVFAELLSEMNCVSLFAEAGIPSDNSFASEIPLRISARLLPSAREESDAARLLVIMYPSQRSVQRFLETPPELFQKLVNLLTPSDDPQFASHEYLDLQEGLRLLSSRVSAIGLNPEMRARSSIQSISSSPFYEIVAATEKVIHAGDHEAVQQALANWRGIEHRCRVELVEVHEHMENSGVSVELIFGLRKIAACLARMESMLAVLTAGTNTARVTTIHGLLGELMRGRLDDLSLSTLLSENLNLIARKMVERTGHSGEHYIAHNKAEYKHMWLAALGGGLLTVLTAAIKVRVNDAHVSPFLHGFAAGTNYAVSFIFLQILGLVLATKQPAATAATFAGIIRESQGLERENRLTDFVARITSTQLAAALGNVFAVCIGAVIFERLWRLIFSGQSYLSETSATYIYETLNPTSSGTAFYAIVTGVILWMAALAGGWCENFAVYYRLPDAVAQHPLGLQLGQGRMKRISRVIQRNLGGWSTSVVLGYLLGFAPEFGKFFGLPIDVRHVTLSTGTLALSVAHFGARSIERTWFYEAIAGIAVIFVLNLFVSFSIAAYVGLRAYDVSGREQWQIVRFLILDGLKSPWRFLWPNYMLKRKAQTVEESENSSAST